MKFEITREKFLNTEELSTLRGTIEHQRLLDPRNCLMIELALLTGARAMELLNLKFSDFEDIDGMCSVYITASKGSRDRQIPLPADIYARVKTRVGDDPSQRVFPISYSRLVQIWADYQPSSKSWHCLRHTMAVLLFKKTKDLKLVQMALGHRRISTTSIYQDFLYTQDELRRMII